DPTPGKVTSRPVRDAPTGVFADYMVGRFALSQSDPTTAAKQLLRARAARRPLAGGGGEVPRTAAPGPHATASAAAGRVGAAGRRPYRYRAGDAPSVPRRPAFPRHLRPARGADRRSGRTRGRCRQALSHRADRVW